MQAILGAILILVFAASILIWVFKIISSIAEEIKAKFEEHKRSNSLKIKESLKPHLEIIIPNELETIKKEMSLIESNLRKSLSESYALEFREVDIRSIIYEPITFFLPHKANEYFHTKQFDFTCKR
jgi:predicted nuclease with TOPRIM domain